MSAATAVLRGAAGAGIALAAVGAIADRLGAREQARARAARAQAVATVAAADTEATSAACHLHYQRLLDMGYRGSITYSPGGPVWFPAQAPEIGRLAARFNITTPERVAAVKAQMGTG